MSSTEAVGDSYAELGHRHPSPIFVETVTDSVDDIYASYPGLSSKGDAFALWAVSYVHDIDLDDALEAVEPILNGPGDGNIDAVYSDDLGQILYIMQSKYSERMDQVYGEEAAQELFAGLDLILSERYAREQGARFQQVKQLVHNALDGGSGVVLELVLAGRMTQEASERLLAYAASYGTPGVSVRLIDANELYRMNVERQSGEDLRGQRVPFVISGKPLEIPASAPGLVSAHVVALDAASLVAAVRMYTSQLVASNVRYQLKGSVINRKIAATISAPELRGRFSLLNNGLTITCSELEIETGRLVLENPQIVNGGQTTMALAQAGASLMEGEVSVVARVVATAPGSEGTTLAREIAEATNRQNPVRPSDLKAVDDIQKRIQADFAALTPPWYYERRRNDRATLGPEKAIYGKRIITKEDVGQRWRAFTGEPAAAVTGKQKIFADLDLYGQVFSPSIDARMYLLAHELFSYFYDLLDGRRVSLRESIAPPIREADRADLMRARNQWSSHCTAGAAYLLQTHHETGIPVTVAETLVEELSEDLRRGTGQYSGLVRLVAIAGHKWFSTRKSAAAAKEEIFAVKAEFQDPATFQSWKAELDSYSGLVGQLDEYRLP